MKFFGTDESWVYSVGGNCLDLTSAWRPPPNLTLDKVEALGKVLPLVDAINVMAFGGEPPESGITPDRGPNFDNVRQRIQAARALFKAGFNADVGFHGAREAGGDTVEPIENDYFRVPRALGRDDNTIETDQLSVSFDLLEGFWAGKHQKWWNVYVDRASFVAWLKGVLAENQSDLAGASRLIVDAMKDNPNLTQSEAFQLVKAKGLDITRQQARDLHKQAGGNQKPGPRGARKNRAEPSA